MDEPQPLGAEREFLPLTDSLASRIRWRACDYASLFSAELELMLSSSVIAGLERDGLPGPQLQSSIRLFQGIPCPPPTHGDGPGESRGAPTPRSVSARFDEP